MLSQTTPGSTSGYASVNGSKMYYEIHGSGMPLVLIHGGGSTIETSFGTVLSLIGSEVNLISTNYTRKG